MNSIGAQRVSIVGFAALELVQGRWDTPSLRQTQNVLDKYDVIWPSTADLVHALQRFGPRRLSHGLDVMDALIAETAIGAGQPLHTFSTRHFAAYPDLTTIQPYGKT
jgi:predicted nucleic acid-binding protein